MPQLFKQSRISSEHNGEILVRTIFGFTEIFVNGYHESTSYMRALWLNAVKRLPSDFVPQTLLMLGLGGGSSIRSLQRRYPGIRITAVEWDPNMIALYRELHSNEAPITILEGDARELVPGLIGQFDLVLIDLFTGDATPPTLAGEDMVRAIAKATAPDGYCVLNAFKSVELLPIFDQQFTRQQSWRFRFNELALYSAK